MSKRTLLLLLALLLAASVSAVASVATPLQAAAHTTYLPLVARQASPVSESLPATLSLGLPFTVLDSAPLNPVLVDGVWYVTVYRVDSGADNGGWGLAILPDSTVQVVAKLAPSDGSENALPPLDEAATRAMARPTQRSCTARIGGQAVAPDGNYYQWCTPSMTGRSRTLVVLRGVKVRS